MNLITKLLGSISGYAIPIVGGVCFVSGLYVSHVWYGYQETKQLKEIHNQEVKQQGINEAVVKNLQDKYLASEQKYQNLQEIVNEIKLTNVPCTLTADAIRLWNKSSNAKKRVPTDSTGTTETNPISNPIEGVGIDLAFKSKVEEDRILEDARNQQQAIIDWNNKTYGN